MTSAVSEKARVGHYLNPATEPRLLREVEIELLEKHETTLLEKDGSGCRALLANDKGEDLSRMYRLFSRVPEGLNPIASILRQHIEHMGNEIINRLKCNAASQSCIASVVHRDLRERPLARRPNA